jgi:IS5 family transposase
VLIFKVLVLQKFCGLSDDGTEEQIFDRTSFKAFLGRRIGDDIPDAKTIWASSCASSRATASSSRPSA